MAKIAEAAARFALSIFTGLKEIKGSSGSRDVKRETHPSKAIRKNDV